MKIFIGHEQKHYHHFLMTHPLTDYIYFAHRHWRSGINIIYSWKERHLYHIFLHVGMDCCSCDNSRIPIRCKNCKNFMDHLLITLINWIITVILPCRKSIAGSTCRRQKSADSTTSVDIFRFTLRRLHGVLTSF